MPMATIQMPNYGGRAVRPQETLSANVQIQIDVVVPTAEEAGGSGGGIKEGMPIFRDRVHRSRDAAESSVPGWIQRTPEEADAKGIDVDFPSSYLAGFSATTVESAYGYGKGHLGNVNMTVTGYRTFFNNGPCVLVPEDDVYVLPRCLLERVVHITGDKISKFNLEKLDNLGGVFLEQGEVARILQLLRTTPARQTALDGGAADADARGASGAIQQLAGLAPGERSVYDSIVEYAMSLVPGANGRYVGAATPLSKHVFSEAMQDDVTRNAFLRCVNPLIAFVVASDDANPLTAILMQPMGPLVLHEACERARATIRSYYAGTVRQSTSVPAKGEMELLVTPASGALVSIV